MRWDSKVDLPANISFSLLWVLRHLTLFAWFIFDLNVSEGISNLSMPVDLEEVALCFWIIFLMITHLSIPSFLLLYARPFREVCSYWLNDRRLFWSLRLSSSVVCLRIVN